MDEKLVQEIAEKLDDLDWGWNWEGIEILITLITNANREKAVGVLIEMEMPDYGHTYPAEIEAINQALSTEQSE